MHLQRAPHGLGGRFQFLARAPAPHVRGDHLLHVVAGERLVGRAQGGVGLLGAGSGAVGGRLGRRAFLQLLNALPESNEAEIVKCGWLESLILGGKGAFQRGLRFAEFACLKLARAGIVELARRGRRSGIRGCPKAEGRMLVSMEVS